MTPSHRFNGALVGRETPATSFFPLIELPIEILEIITTFLPQYEALQFGLTCKLFYEIAMKRLYRNILVYVPSFEEQHKGAAFRRLANWTIYLVDAHEVFGTLQVTAAHYIMFHDNAERRLSRLVQKNLKKLLSPDNSNLKYIHRLMLYSRNDLFADVTLHSLLLNGTNFLPNLKQLYSRDRPRINDDGNVEFDGFDADSANIGHGQFRLYSSIVTKFGGTITNLQITLNELIRVKTAKNKFQKVRNRALIQSFQNVESLVLHTSSSISLVKDNYALFDAFANLRSLALENIHGDIGIPGFISWLSKNPKYRTQKLKLDSLSFSICHSQHEDRVFSKLNASPFVKTFDLNSITKLKIHISCYHEKTGCKCVGDFLSSIAMPNVTELTYWYVWSAQTNISNYIVRFPKLKKVHVANDVFKMGSDEADGSHRSMEYLKVLPSKINTIIASRIFIDLKEGTLQFMAKLQNHLMKFQGKTIENVLRFDEYFPRLFDDRLISAGIGQEGFDFWNMPNIIDYQYNMSRHLNSYSMRLADVVYTEYTPEDVLEIIQFCVNYAKRLVVYLISRYKELEYLNLGIAQFNVMKTVDGRVFARCINVARKDIFAVEGTEFPNFDD